jgi:hypothetical protein
MVSVHQSANQLVEVTKENDLSMNNIPGCPPLSLSPSLSLSLSQSLFRILSLFSY